MERREFLKKLGLGSLGVAMMSAPVLASVIDESIKQQITTPQEFFNQKITAYTYRKQRHPNISSMTLNKSRNVTKGNDYVDLNYYSKWFTNKLECEYAAMLDMCRVNETYKRKTLENLVEEFDLYDRSIIVEEHNVPIGAYINNMFSQSHLTKELLFKDLEIEK